MVDKDGNIKLIVTLFDKEEDFGFSEFICRDHLYNKQGSPGYIPPEMFQMQPYTDKGDVYQVGVIAFTLLTGSQVFKGGNNQQVLVENKQGVVNFAKLQNIEIKE